MASNLRSRAKAKAAPILSPKASTSQGESSSPPPGDEEKAKCAICLGDLVNKSYSNSCCHQFCFGCLLEWSKVKPECPLCKSSFTTIIHNIRSDSVYDEYHVPPIMRSPPIPMLSVPYFHHLHGIQDDIMALRSHRFHPYGPSVPAGLAPNWYHRDRAHHMNFRILEYVSIDRRAEYVNPFRNGQTEFFGTSINLHNDPMSSPITNYQARRRIYDRNQWVEPLRGTFQEGSVVFPSVEYIRTHPTAKTRITGWLYRELTVLLGLQMSMHEMANVFDVIMRVLETYDIRSPEFRELVTSYFGDKTRHFQHEFFNFVISGMSIEEYDRNACYSNNRNRSNDPGSTLFVPPIVTIDDSEEEDNRASSRRGENECVVIADALPNAGGVGSSGSMRAGLYPTSSATASTSSCNIGSADMPWDLSTGNSFEPPTNNVIAERRRRYLQRNPVSSNSAERGSGVEGDVNVGDDQDLSWRSRRSSQAGNSSRASLLSQQCRNYQEVYDRMRSQIPEVSPRPCHDNTAPDSSWPSLLRFAEVSPPHYRQRNNEANVAVDRVQSAPAANINLTHEEVQPSNNDDDCVLLGVHPVVKKPPLAVITISDSSDNEGENAALSSQARSESVQRQPRNQCKNEVLENPEVQVPDVFMEMCFRDPPLPSDAGAAASASHRNYVSVSSSSSSCSSRAPSPISSNTSNSLRMPTYYFEPSYSYSTDGISPASSSQLGSRRREAVTEAAVPSSSKRLRLLDSKKPKSSSSKHKKSSSRKKHRSTSGSRKKKRNRSPSSSSSDEHRSTRKNKTPHSSSSVSSKRVSKKKKSRRIIYSSESSSEDSDSSTASCGSSPTDRRRRSKHEKLPGSRSTSKNPDSQKSRKRHKSKKKHASSTSSRKKSRRHHSKKSGPLSLEYLPSTDDSSTEDDCSHELPRLLAYSPVAPDSPELLPLGQSHPASSTDPENGLHYHLSSPSVNGDYNLLLAPSNLEARGGIVAGSDASPICNVTEASSNAAGSAELVRPEEDNFGSELRDLRELDRPSGERQCDSEDWDVTSPSSYLLNLSMSRGTSDEFWS